MRLNLKGRHLAVLYLDGGGSACILSIERLHPDLWFLGLIGFIPILAIMKRIGWKDACAVGAIFGIGSLMSHPGMRGLAISWLLGFQAALTIAAIAAFFALLNLIIRLYGYAIPLIGFLWFLCVLFLTASVGSANDLCPLGSSSDVQKDLSFLLGAPAVSAITMLMNSLILVLVSSGLRYLMASNKLSVKSPEMTWKVNYEFVYDKSRKSLCRWRGPPSHYPLDVDMASSSLISHHNIIG